MNREDEPLRLPTINWAQPIDQPANGAYYPGDAVYDPPGLARPFVTNSAPKKDDEPLRLPVMNWAAE